MSDTLIKSFKQISKAEIEIAGGKGASLGEMLQAGIPVPDGFVILSIAFNRFIEETDLNVEIEAVLDEVNINKVHTVENASEKIQAIILSKEIPEDINKEILNYYHKLDCKFVAVRSSATSEDSATAAWAGQLESYLNSTQETLLQNIKHCWASLFTPRAIFYRFEKDLIKEKISVAVVVQKMVDSEESGIAFSVHPVTQDENQIIIEAGFGLGEAIVSGSITPDSYVVDKQGFSILDINVNKQIKALYRKSKGGNEWKELGEKGKKQVLTEKEIVELSKLIVKIEKHYGFPCDIEWAKVKGKFYIVQSRPITTLNIRRAKKPSVEDNLKQTEMQIEWNGPFSLFHYSLVGPGYFKSFNKIFGINVSFVYISYDNGVATAYLPTDQYQKIGIHLLEKAKNKKFREKWIYNFKQSAARISYLVKNLEANSFQNQIRELKELYLIYVPYQVATKIVSNYLSGKKEKNIFNEFEKARKYSDKLFLNVEMSIMKILNRLKQKFRRTKKQLMFCLFSEIDNPPKSKILQARYNRCAVFSSEQGHKVLNGKVAKDIENYWMSLSDEGILRGNVVFQGGIVQGKCRIIHDYKNATIKNGEILVTGMTDPNFVPIMKKARAVITDGGGVLCHAAIVSRELKKPCVIGTRFATKILQDGDLVEVDANSGIITVLKKSN